MKIPGHSKGGHWQAKENNAADQAAKTIAGLQMTMIAVTTKDEQLDAGRPQSTQDSDDVQVKTPKKEQKLWEEG